MAFMVTHPYLLLYRNKNRPLPGDEELPEEREERSFDGRTIPDNVKVLLPVKTKEGVLEARFAERNNDTGEWLDREVVEYSRQVEDE